MVLQKGNGEGMKVENNRLWISFGEKSGKRISRKGQFNSIQKDQTSRRVPKNKKKSTCFQSLQGEK